MFHPDEYHCINTWTIMMNLLIQSNCPTPSHVQCPNWKMPWSQPELLFHDIPHLKEHLVVSLTLFPCWYWTRGSIKKTPCICRHTCVLPNHQFYFYILAVSSALLCIYILCNLYNLVIIIIIAINIITIISSSASTSSATFTTWSSPSSLPSIPPPSLPW